MAITVNNAFAEFLKDKVRLDKDRTKIAKASKTWLVEEIKKFPDNGKFPLLHPDTFIDYGSFSRKTKIRPLDDIDLMIILHGQGGTYYSNFDLTISNTGNAAQFFDLCFEGTSQLNSIKVINLFKEYLGKIPQYKKADIKRNLEAVTLELESYEWIYDIVPCFITNAECNGRTYYVIPDGKGNWKKTDPRIDAQTVLSAQSGQEVSVVDVIRLAKYWNKRPTMPSMDSYLLENIVLNFYNSGIHNNWVDIEFKDLLAYVSEAILYPVQDRKGIQGDLNTLSWVDRNKIKTRAFLDHQKATQARIAEDAKRIKEAINGWRDIFGTEFPEFTFQSTLHA